MPRPSLASARMLTGQREPCRLASTANVASLGGLGTLDGVALETGDRLLLKDQSDPRENGIYTASVGPWYRAADARDPRAVQLGVRVYVQEGVANTGRTFAFASDVGGVGIDPILLAESAEYSSAFGARNTAQGRLSLASTMAVSPTDVAAGPTIYYLPAGGSLVPVWTGISFEWMSFGNGLALPLDPDASHEGYHAANFNYDVFMVVLGGLPVLCTGPTWGAGVTPSPNLTKQRATGAGSTELTTLQGIIVNKFPIRARIGLAPSDVVTIPENRATYLGSFKAVANGTARDTRQSRLLYNAYNQAFRSFSRLEDALSWEFSLSVYRQMNGNLANQVDVLMGLEGGVVDLTLKAYATNSTPTVQSAICAIGQDSLVAPKVFSYFAVPEARAAGTTRFCDYPGMGYSYFSMLERGAGIVGQDQTWFGGSELTGGVLI